MRFSFKISSSNYRNAFDISTICLIIDTLDIFPIVKALLNFLNLMMIVVTLSHHNLCDNYVIMYEYMHLWYANYHNDNTKGYDNHL